MTLTEMTATLDRHGLYLNNLFQLSAGTWRASTRKKGAAIADQTSFHFHDAATPESAILGALALGIMQRPLSRTYEKPSRTPVTLGDLDL